MPNRLEQLCTERGWRLSDKRRAILAVLDDADDHPTAKDVYTRALSLAPGLSLATVYRNMKQLSELGLVTCHAFGDDKAHYEETRGDHHEHLIDVHTGKVVEVAAPEVADLIRDIAARLGYQLLEYRLEMFATPNEAPAHTEERPARLSSVR